MKKICFFAALLLPLSLFSDTIVFEKTFGGMESEFAHLIRQTADGGYIVAGQTDSFGNGSALNPDLWIIKLDMAGNIEWDKTFGKPGKGDGAFSVEQTSDEGYIVAGTTSSYGEGYPSIWIIKLDADGDSVWTQIYEGPVVSSARSIRQTSDGGYIIAGNGEENVLKLDGNGNREWGRHYGWIFYCVQQTADGGYVLAGDSIHQQLEWSYIPSLSVIKLDENGNKEWSDPSGNEFLGRANCIHQTTDGGYVIAGDSIDFRSEFEYSYYFMVIKLNENGNRDWVYSGGEYSSAQSIQQTADGGYIAAGTMTDDGDGLDFLIVKLDGNGNEEWKKTYGSSGGWEYASSIQQTVDGGYVVAGQTDSYGAGRYDMWVLKLDENGNGPGPVGVFEPGYNRSPDFSLSQNYPNPFNQSTAIRMNLPEPGFVTLTVYDCRGREIETIVREWRPAGPFNVEWTAKSLPSGMYFYRLKAGRYAETKRCILQK